MAVPDNPVPCPAKGDTTPQGPPHAPAHHGPHRTAWRQNFGCLLEQHRAWIVRRCRTQLGNTSDAQDVAQDVILRGYLALAKFEGRGSLRAWLRAIADNQCRTFAVRRAKYITLEHIEALTELYERNHTSSDLDEKDDQRDFIATALAKSPTAVREILYLRFFQDCSLADIASRLDISLSAAKMRLYRALTQLKVAYDTSTNP